jgi:murein DD-endopeptidase MepM/ murein hydrolase activator NlpD
MKKIASFSIALSLIFVFGLPKAIFAQTSADQLQGMINQKNTELQQIQNQRDVFQAQLNVISQSNKTLKSEIDGINYRINQLDLQQKSNRLTVEKLTLEISSMSRDIMEAEVNISKRKEAISDLFREMQSQDRNNLLTIVLQTGGLSESVTRANELVTLNSSLAKSIEDLRSLQDELSDKLQTESQRKRQREIEQANIANNQYILQDQKSEKQEVLSQTKSQEKIYQDQIDKLDEQQSAISEFIEEIEHTLRASFDPSLLPLKRPGVLKFPVSKPILTQYYGPTKFAERNYRTGTHTGVDFGASIGTPVFAAGNGKISRVDNNDRGTSRWNRYQYGRYILLEHDNNLTTLYAHLSKAVVKAGDQVKEGDLIGYAGNSGYTTGPHLHFGLYWTPSIQLKPVPPAAGLVPIGITIDPMDYLPSSDIISMKGSK